MRMYPMLGLTVSFAADTTTEINLLIPGGGIGSSQGNRESEGFSNTRFHNSPPEIARSIVAMTKQMITIGSERVSPYRKESGLSCGAAKTNARIVAVGTPALRISRATGITPREQTGSRDPITHALNSPLSPSPPNKFRVDSGPNIRRITAATKNPTNKVEEASTAV